MHLHSLHLLIKPRVARKLRSIDFLKVNYLCIVKTIHEHLSLESKDVTCVGFRCECANGHGTCDFAGDTDLQAPFHNDVWHICPLLLLTYL